MLNESANQESWSTTYYQRVFSVIARIFFKRTRKNLYTCKKCGCHQFIVEHLYIQDIVIEDLLRCSCDDLDKGFAAIFQNRLTKGMRSWGPLDETHNVEKWDEEEVESTAEQDNNPKINCSKCYENDTGFDWEAGEEFEPEIFDEEWFVRCGECDREIEFGWSHPNRGGRIWTAEDRDFNPWKCFPEERYLAKWRVKGWLKPSK